MDEVNYRLSPRLYSYGILSFLEFDTDALARRINNEVESLDALVDLKFSLKKSKNNEGILVYSLRSQKKIDTGLIKKMCGKMINYSNNRAVYFKVFEPGACRALLLIDSIDDKDLIEKAIITDWGS